MPVQGGDNPPKVADKKKDSAAADASKRADRDKDEDTSVANVTKGSGDSAAADAGKKRADWPGDDDDDKKKDDAAKRKDGGGGWQNEGNEGKDPPKDKDWDKKDSKGDAMADARADAYESMAARLKALEERHTMPEETMAAFTDAQAFADDTFQLHGKRAPASLPGEAPWRVQAPSGHPAAQAFAAVERCEDVGRCPTRRSSTSRR